MAFAADALLDMQPPPRAAAKIARVESASGGESFADHLDVATNEPTEVAVSPRSAKKAPADPEPSDQIASMLVTAPLEQPTPTNLLTLISALAGEQPETPPPVAEALPDAATPAPPSPAPMKADIKAANVELQQSAEPEADMASADTPTEAILSAESEAGAQARAQQAAPLPLALVSLVAQHQAAPTATPTPKSQDLRLGEAKPRGAQPDAPPLDTDKKAPEPAPNLFKAALKAAQDGAEQPKPNPPLALERLEANSGSSQTAPTQTAALQGAAPTEHVASAHAMARALPAANQVAQEIIRRFDGESTQFDLRLDPPELGRIDVRLEVSRDHRVTAIVAADNPQALAELVRHARELEQMLQSAGLQLSDKGLSFDLRQGGERSADARSEGAGSDSDRDSGENPTAPPISARPVGFERWRGVRVDISV
jgi:flagellar hook-length control protein FliK